MKKQIITTVFAFAASAAFAQTGYKTISGTVTEAARHIGLPGVMVTAYGDNKYSAMTDSLGRYTLKVPAWVTSVTMRVEGYNLVQVPVGRATHPVNASLYPSVFQQQYDKLTTAATEASSSAFDNTSYESIDPLIAQNMGSTVRCVSKGGNVGVGNVMFIDGLNSLNTSAQPLIVVDGVIMDMQYDREMLHSGYYNNILANINVNDIEKVTVLRNATAIYGAKGANGVILIKTKQNKSMATKIDLTINGRFERIPKLPEMMGADDYRVYATELLSDQTTNVSSLGFATPDPSYYYYKKFHNNTDWKDLVYRNSFSSNYGINVQGGDDVANYNLSVGYSYANSTLKKNDFSRFNMRLSSDISVIRSLNVHFDASYSDINRSLFDDGMPDNVNGGTITSPGVLGLVKAPFLSPYSYDINGNLSSYLSEADDYLKDVYGSDESLANPGSILQHGDGRNRNHFGNRLITMAMTPRYNVNRHLTLSDQLSFMLVNTDENYYLPLTGVPRFKAADMNVYVNNIAQSLSGKDVSFQNDFRVNWDKRYGMHHVKVLGGLRYLSQSYTLNLQRGYNSSNDKTPNMSGSLAYKTTKGADDKSRDFTAYLLSDYNIAEKYYLTVGISGQASSRFGDDSKGLSLFGVKWGVFPSVQAGWVLTNERWMAAVKPINYLRFNVGFDITGNDNIDYLASRTYSASHRMLGGNVTGLSLRNISNTSLTWEQTSRFTAGFETNLFNNIVNLKFDVFSSKTTDLLMLHQLAYTSGLRQMWGNDGSLKNKGFDLSVNMKLLNLKDWQWELGGSMGHYKNEMTKLPDGNKAQEHTIYGADVLTAVGGPVAQFYGYRTAGVFSTQAEADAAGLYLIDDNGNRQYFKAGDMRFVDQNGDHLIDARDKVVIGDPNPDIYGNINTSLTWRHWNLDIVFNYVLGNDVFNYQRSVLEGGNDFINQTTAMLGRWNAEGQQTQVPRIEYNDPMGNSRFSDRWIEDGSYLRLKALTLSYQMPLNLMFLRGFTIWGSIYNLFTLTHYLGDDPDCSLSGSVLSQGIDRGLLGNGRSFSLGLKLNL